VEGFKTQVKSAVLYINIMYASTEEYSLQVEKGRSNQTRELQDMK
jgi:hypothetical protein